MSFWQKLLSVFKKKKVELPKIEVQKEEPVKVPEVEKVERKYVVGIDIYHGDIITSWTDLAKEIDFIFIKATEGDWRNDPMFGSHRKNANDLGIPCGHYHFYRSNKDPIEQAKDFVSAIGRLYHGELPPVCDWETEDDPQDGNDMSEVQKFLDYVEEKLGVAPIIYSGSYFASDKKLPKSFTKYLLWLAHYTKSNPRTPAPWTKWTFWQNTDKAIVKGVKKPCDFNYFNGTKEELLALCKKG